MRTLPLLQTTTGSGIHLGIHPGMHYSVIHTAQSPTRTLRLHPGKLTLKQLPEFAGETQRGAAALGPVPYLLTERGSVRDRPLLRHYHNSAQLPVQFIEQRQSSSSSTSGRTVQRNPAALPHVNPPRA